MKSHECVYKKILTRNKEYKKFDMPGKAFRVIPCRDLQCLAFIFGSFFFFFFPSLSTQRERERERERESEKCKKKKVQCKKKSVDVQRLILWEKYERELLGTISGLP